MNEKVAFGAWEGGGAYGQATHLIVASPVAGDSRQDPAAAAGTAATSPTTRAGLQFHAALYGPQAGGQAEYGPAFSGEG
jgi:hypothetical protein